MLAGRVYRIFQRYADIHVAFDMPGVALRDASGAEPGRIDRVAVRRNRLWLEGQARGHSVEMRINRTLRRQDLDPEAAQPEQIRLDVPLETGPVEVTLTAGDGAAAARLPGVSARRLTWARRRMALRFLWVLLCLAPVIYRWKWQGDLGAREVVKERLGLVPRPEAGLLPAELLSVPAAPVACDVTATLVMPVHNAFEVMQEALERVARHSGAGWRLVLVEDVSSDARVRPFLEDWCADPARAAHVTLVCLSENLGFIGAVNRGLEEARQRWPEDPVVLLNSDALVPRGWLPRLLAPLADPAVASVTPMSNDAEIFSVPGICRRSDLAPGAADVIDAAAARLDPVAAQVEVPTGVGFCMALAPRFLARVPLLDTAFGRGYGEENDWCQKTRALGGRHLGLGNLFVEHRGGTSFGSAAKQRLLEKNLAEIARRYPTYDQQVQDFVTRDPLAGARLALGMVWAGAHQEAPVPVYLAHAMGGGADHDLNRHIAADVAAGRAVVVVRVGLRLRWQVELHTPFGVTRGLSDDTDLLVALIAHLPRRRIVYSCGVGDSDAVGLPDVLLRLACEGAGETPHPVEVLIHDYFPISPSYTLLGADGAYHGVPLAGGPLAADPAHQARRPRGQPRATLADWQAAWGRLMAAAARVTVFSEASRAIVATAYPQAGQALEVVPHRLLQVPARIAPVPRGPDGPVIGVLGNIGPQKGAAVVRALSRDLSRSGTGQVVVIGYMDPDYRLTAPSRVHGAYELGDLPGLVSRYHVSCWLIPSIWPETFSFTTHEALATGLPVFAFDLGAQGGAVARAVADGAPGGVLPLPEGQQMDPGLIIDHPALAGAGEGHGSRPEGVA